MRGFRIRYSLTFLLFRRERNQSRLRLSSIDGCDVLSGFSSLPNRQYRIRLRRNEIPVMSRFGDRRQAAEDCLPVFAEVFRTHDIA